MSLRSTVKNWFKNGLKPTQQQFHSLFDFLRFKDENIDAKEVEGLDALLFQKADKQVFEAHKNNDPHITPAERLKLEGLSQITRLSQLINDAGFGKIGDPIKWNQFIAFTPKNYIYKMNGIGAIQIDVPVVPINFNSCTLIINLTPNFLAAKKFSATIVVNCLLFKSGSEIHFLFHDACITSSSSDADLAVRFANGIEPCIYIGEETTDLSNARVSITRVIAETNGNLTDAAFEDIQNSFVVSQTTKFKAVGLQNYRPHNLVQGKVNPIWLKDHLNNPVLDLNNGLKIDEDLVIDTEKETLGFKHKRFKLYNDVSYSVADLTAGRVDLLNETFVANEIIRDFDTLDLVINLDLFLPSGASASGNFSFTIDCCLNRNLSFGYSIIKFEILNFNDTKKQYIQNIVIMHKIMLANMNGFKYMTKTITIDCSKSPDQTTEEKVNHSREYFDYPISDNINAVDNNKLRLNFTNSPFAARIRTLVKKNF